MGWWRTFTLTVGLAWANPAAHADGGLAHAARARVGQTVLYDPSYQTLSYPGGDVPNDRGVCTDVVIRSLRAAYGFDLQKHVHADMSAAFDQYPELWGLTKPDKHIDHRRVPNLEVFLSRQGARMPMGELASDFAPGDIVTWRIGGKLAHIGIVSDQQSAHGTPLVIHNMGRGTKEEDVLFAFPRTMHFRFHPVQADPGAN